MPRRRLPPKLRLSKFEAAMLTYPPNEGTWLCQSEICLLEGDMVQGSNTESCWVCGSPKGDDPVMVWPLYVEACAKVGIIPGEMVWKYNTETGRAVVKDRFARNRWSTWEPETPVRLEVAQRR